MGEGEDEKGAGGPGEVAAGVVWSALGGTAVKALLEGCGVRADGAAQKVVGAGGATRKRKR